MRAVGVYCSWLKLTDDGWKPSPKGELLKIEKVSGNGAVTSFDCTAKEAQTIREFLNA